MKLRFETDLGTSLKASADLAAAYDKVGTALQKTAREAKAMEQAAKRIVDQNLTPLENYNRKLQQLVELKKAGKISEEMATRAAIGYRVELEKATQVTNTLNHVTEKANRNLVNSKLELEKAAKAEAARAAAMQKTKAVSDNIFGPSALEQVLSYGQGFVGVAGAISIVSGAFQRLEADADSAMNRVFGSLGSFGQLQQVSTSEKDFLQLVGKSRSLVGPVFGKDQSTQAADFIFAMRNAGYTDQETDTIVKLGSSGQVKPEDMQKVAEGLKKAQDVFGKAEAGSIEQVANKVFVAANAMQTDFAQAAVATTLFGTESKGLASDEEALAAFVAIEKQSPGAEEAATRLRGLFTQIKKDGLAKGSFKETMDSLLERVHKGEAPIKVLGETRAAAGLEILAGAEGQSAYEQQLKDITAANTQDAIGSRRFLGADPQLNAARLKKASEGALAQSEESLYAEKESLFDAMRAEVKKRSTDRGDRVGAVFGDIMYGLSDTFGSENTALQSAIDNRQQLGLSDELTNSINDYLRRIAENTEEKTKPARPSGRQE